jgi:hypothetical protein
MPSDVSTSAQSSFRWSGGAGLATGLVAFTVGSLVVDRPATGVPP